MFYIDLHLNRKNWFDVSKLQFLEKHINSMNLESTKTKTKIDESFKILSFELMFRPVTFRYILSQYIFNCMAKNVQFLIDINSKITHELIRNESNMW